MAALVLVLVWAAWLALPARLLQPAAAQLNVLISQPEVMKLLGLDAELYYVRGGVVNSYATSFIVPVPAHVSDLHFMWQALGRTPLPYVMGIEYESRGAMLPPQVNISERGLVPTTLQTFRVRLPCSGARSAEILVSLQLNISAADRAHHDIALLFKRNKICLKGLSSVAQRNESSVVAGEAARARASGVVYAGAGCAVAALALLAAAATAGALYRRGGKARHHDSIHTSYTTAAYGSHQNVLLRLDTLGRAPSSTGSYATIASLHKFPFGSRRSPSPYATTHIGEHVYAAPEHVSYYAASTLTHVSQQTVPVERAVDPAEQLRLLSTPRSNVRLGDVLVEGTFGRLQRAVLAKGDVQEEVLVKTVTEAASALQAALLVAEGLRLGGLAHGNVLAPRAAVPLPARPLLLYACADTTINLKRFLVSCREGQRAAPAARELVSLGAQAARGVAYLHAAHLVHADLAARNCVVDEKLRLKVTDNALSRDLFPDEYHCLADNDNRPVKWMAPETLLQGIYSTASDVWSLGVVLWELAALGGAPLAELDAADVAACLAAGYRPAQPATCPDEMYGLMSWCWSAASGARPSAPQLLAALHDFRQALTTYI